MGVERHMGSFSRQETGNAFYEFRDVNMSNSQYVCNPPEGTFHQIRMNPKDRNLLESLHRNFPFSPTVEQGQLLKELLRFALYSERFELFLLKGYAGTGKTTVVSTLVNSLGDVGLRSVLLAPTGRAAKVISRYSNRVAHTIHRKIYFASRHPDGSVSLVLQKNKHRNTIFIADEASMISDHDSDLRTLSSRSLLEDLLRYVYTGKNCKLILVGDTAQLPPVGLALSPALDPDVFRERFRMKVSVFELSEVMRQHERSGVLFNATRIRARIKQGSPGPTKFDLSYPDIQRLQDPYDTQDAIQEAFTGGEENTVFIVRSNRRANLYNHQIRISVLGLDDEIAAGDRVMVVKNNYFWLEDSEHVGFIANGDICELLEIFNYRELHGFRFAEVKLRLVDYEDQPPFEAVILLDTLHSETASLSQEDGYRLYHSVAEDYAHLRDRQKRLAAIKGDKFFNALQIKFAYALTCHKTQGGQWPTVFIEQPYLPEGEDISYLRWLYTGVTRAQEKLYLIGFPDECFEE